MWDGAATVPVFPHRPISENESPDMRIIVKAAILSLDFALRFLYIIYSLLR